ncbi:hypothetical protein Y032_0222g2596 [Ancylostoma ceylanicum]|uniref:Uncharacterized protein n=1 Tax=Ancylostoma ceylanicum TaxID=53326 RepID=A0A016SIP3_9BILA|nr:hypothetical protein Y032_0222g2596 [Ancylostoma ceylanicum]
MLCAIHRKYGYNSHIFDKRPILNNVVLSDDYRAIRGFYDGEWMNDSASADADTSFQLRFATDNGCRVDFNT